MPNWFDEIISSITFLPSNPLIVIDEYGFLDIAEIKNHLLQAGYKLYYPKPEEIRVMYELAVEETPKSILIVSYKYRAVDDLIAKNVIVTIDPNKIFRFLNPLALKGLSYQALSHIMLLPIYQKLSYEETIKLILENIYEIDVQTWLNNKTKERTLAYIIDLFNNKEYPNNATIQYVGNIAKTHFKDDIRNFASKEDIFTFIDNLPSQDINLDDPVLKKRISNLKFNIDYSNSLKNKQKIETIISNLQSTLQTLDEQYSDWFNIAPKIGQLGALVYKLQDENIEKSYLTIIKELNNRFQQFLDSQYEQLFTMNALIAPKTIDKVQEFISSNSKQNKIAFIVIDGMNLWQWTLLKNSLEQNNVEVGEKILLSWIPSITAWARQSIFSGKRPDLTINNSQEKDLFFTYWIKRHKKQKYQLFYQRLNSCESLNIPSENITVAGFVYNSLDNMMHGTVLGYTQLYQSTLLWIKESKICQSIKYLLSNKFDVYISTDHGNIDANLNLKLSPSQKSISLSRSKRFINFDSEHMASKFIQDNIAFKLGRRGNSVYFRDNNGFGNSKQNEITHGGSHIMEMLIPLGVIKC